MSSLNTLEPDAIESAETAEFVPGWAEHLVDTSGMNPTMRMREVLAGKADAVTMDRLAWQPGGAEIAS